MTRYRLIPLAVLLLAEAAALGVLHALGATPGLGAGTLVSAAAPAEDVVMAAARLAALALAWWLFATTWLCVLARLARLPSALRAVEWAALPAVRRLVERSLVVTLSLSAATVAVPIVPGVAVGAAAQSYGPAALAPVVERGVVVPPAARLPGPSRAAPPAAAAATSQEPGSTAGALPRLHRVARGEHLWGLAAEVLAQASGRSPATLPPAEVAAYWVRLVEANPDSLRSGDPDLVYPGERLHLPPLSG